MKQRQIRKELAKSIRTVLRKRTFPITFRDYQRETLESTVRWLELPRGSRAAYVAHATGLGKTVLFATLVSEAKNLNCLVVVPNKLLVAQTVREIVKLTNHAIGHVSSLGKIHDIDGEEIVAMRGHNGHRIVVTTDQSFKRRAMQLSEEFRPHLIIRDECHWSYTEKSQDAVELFPQAVIIGYSATPDYLTTTAKASYIPVTLDNGQTLYAPPDRVAQAYYPELIDRRTVRWGIENEHLAPLAWGLLEFDISLDDVPVTDTPAGMDYDPEELRKAIAEHWPMMEETIVRLYEDNVYDIRRRQVCAMCPGVAEAESLAKKISRFVPSACITGTTPDDVRDETLRSFDTDIPKKETVRFISSVFVLREGWDARNAEIALMLRPTKSRVLYEQFLGRILRLRRDGREKVALALDALFLRTRLMPLSAPVLYGVPGEVVEGDILIGPNRHEKKLMSPYLPKNVRPKVRIIQALEIEYRAGEEGFFEADGQTWGHRKAWARMLKIDDASIDSRLKKTGCVPRVERDHRGKAQPFYAEVDVRRACAELLIENRTGPDGTFIDKVGRQWAHINGLARLFKIHAEVVKLRTSNAESKKARNFGGQSIIVYCVEDVRKACADLLRVKMHIGPDGSCSDKRGRKFGSIVHWAKTLGVKKDTLRRRLKRCRKSKKVKSARGYVLVYPEDVVKEVCADLMLRRQANQNKQS